MTDSDIRTAFKEHSEAVYRFTWRMTGSPIAAEDITQDVFLFLLRRPDQFDPQRGQLRAFLIGVARNLARKWLLHESRWNELDDEQLVAEPANAEGREIAKSVGAAVSSLPATQREVLLLAHYEGFSLDEIARIVNIEVGTVKSRLHRARQNLKRKLGPLWFSNRKVGNGIAK